MNPLNFDEPVAQISIPSLTQGGALVAWLLLIGVMLFVVLAALKRIKFQSSASPAERVLSWLRNYYWVTMMLTGIALGVIAATFYLVEIGYSVTGIVNRLRAEAWSDEPDATNLRNLATATAVLLAALAAAATMIFQLVKVWITERQTKTSEQSHITDQINKAVAGLGTEKNVKGDGDTETTKPNIEVRVGAIYALERIAQDSPRDHVQIMEILTAYIRENAKAEDAEPNPQAKDSEFDRNAIRTWANTLKARTDTQAAMQVIARRTAKQRRLEQEDRRYGEGGYRLDLRACNLQAVDISGLNLSRALLTGSKLEGANLSRAHLEGAYLYRAHLEEANLPGAHLEWANLYKAHLEGANLYRAHLEGANFIRAHLEWVHLTEAHLEGTILISAHLEGANLTEAHLEGAILSGAQLDADTSLKAATLRGAAVRQVDYTSIAWEQSQIDDVFGDASVKLPPTLTRPAHWPDWEMDWFEFQDEWRKWQADPASYIPPEKPS